MDSKGKIACEFTANADGSVTVKFKTLYGAIRRSFSNDVMLEYLDIRTIAHSEEECIEKAGKLNEYAKIAYKSDNSYYLTNPVVRIAKLNVEEVMKP